MLSPSEAKNLVKYLKEKPGSSLSRPFSKSLMVFSVGDVPYAYLETGRQMLELSLRSVPELAKVLRDKYEEVLPGQKLDKRVWNTIVVSGQLNYAELTALIDHSYQMACDLSA